MHRCVVGVVMRDLMVDNKSCPRILRVIDWSWIGRWLHNWRRFELHLGTGTTVEPCSVGGSVDVVTIELMYLVSAGEMDSRPSLCPAVERKLGTAFPVFSLFSRFWTSSDVYCDGVVVKSECSGGG
eukprot:1992665-Amphidinium_carterae.2